MLTRLSVATSVLCVTDLWTPVLFMSRALLLVNV